MLSYHIQVEQMKALHQACLNYHNIQKQPKETRKNIVIIWIIQPQFTGIIQKRVEKYQSALNVPTSRT